MFMTKPRLCTYMATRYGRIRRLVDELQQHVDDDGGEVYDAFLNHVSEFLEDNIEIADAVKNDVDDENDVNVTKLAENQRGLLRAIQRGRS